MTCHSGNVIREIPMTYVTVTNDKEKKKRKLRSHPRITRDLGDIPTNCNIWDLFRFQFGQKLHKIMNTRYLITLRNYFVANSNVAMCFFG